MEPGYRVAVSGGEVPAALRPLHDGEEFHALRGQPGALLAGGEVDVRLRPAPRPAVLLAVEAGRTQPVRERELGRVADAQPPLLRRIDEEQTAERPERLPAQRRLRLL